MELEKQYSSLSLKQKLRIICAYCCDADEEEDDIQKPLEHEHSSDKLNRQSLKTWLKSELAHLISFKQGRNRGCKSSEFKYDPFSYALNFEDDDSNLDDDYPLRNFSSRLPPSPVKENYYSKDIVVSTQKSNWS